MTMRRSILTTAFAAMTTLGMLTVPAGAAPGTWTKITTPAGPAFHFHYVDGGGNTFTVSGKASTDVTQVDIYCFAAQLNMPQSVPLAAAVPVTAGSFSATAQFPQLATNCRMRAVPTGQSLTGYLASFSGPLVYTFGIRRMRDGAATYNYQAIGEGPHGLMVFTDAGQYGAYALLSVDTPASRISVIGNLANFALREQNITASGTPTSTAVQVDGHTAYLPYAVHDLLVSNSIPVTQTAIDVSMTSHPNGDTTVTESSPLVRCSGDDTYPPTTVSCPSVVQTGVKLVRVMHFFRGNHQTSVRDSFIGTNAVSHTVKLQYLAAVEPESNGAPGFIFPKHGSAFRRAHSNQTMTGFGNGAASVLERSDVYASPDDPAADTSAVTWSRPPSSVRFAAGSSAYLYGMNYTVHVPAHKAGYVGFAVSERQTTTDVKPLAKLAERDMMTAPKITAPKNGSVVHGKKTTVTGRLGLGANGLPTSVKVNGHAAKITVKNAKSAIFSATFREAFGRHRIKVVATDAGGNTRTAAVTVTNRR